MATKKIAYIDVNFAITVRVPVDCNLLPAACVREGSDLNDVIKSDLWNQIVSDACEAMEGPDGSNVEDMVVSSIEEEEVEEQEEVEENPDAMYDDCPEYVHDAAIDWLYDHAAEYDDRDEAMQACKEQLAEEGYHIFLDKECEWAVEDAFDDYDGDAGWDW